MYWWERFSECGKKTYLDQNPPAPPKRTMIPGNILKSMKQCKKKTILILSFLIFWGYLYPYAVWLYSVILTVSFISPQWSQFLLPATALHLFHLDLLASPQSSKCWALTTCRIVWIMKQPLKYQMVSFAVLFYGIIYIHVSFLTLIMYRFLWQM